MSREVPTYDDFIAKYPVFTPPAVSQEEILEQLDFATRLLSPSAWHDWLSDGIMLLTAHEISMGLLPNSNVGGGLQGARGNVSSASGAGISVAFESLSSTPGDTSSNWYNRSTYGQKYMRLQSLVVSGASLAY